MGKRILGLLAVIAALVGAKSDALAVQHFVQSGVYFVSQSGPVPQAGAYVNCNATGGNVALTLPRAVGNLDPVTLIKTDSSSNTCSLSAAAGDSLDVAVSVGTQYGNVTVLDRNRGNWGVLTSSIGLAQYAQAPIPIAMWVPSPSNGALAFVYPCGSQIELPAALASTSFPATNTQTSCGTVPSQSGDVFTLANRDTSTTLATVTLSTTCNAGGASTYSTVGFCSSGNCVACTAGQTLTLTSPATVHSEANVMFMLMGITP